MPLNMSQPTTLKEEVVQANVASVNYIGIGLPVTDKPDTLDVGVSFGITEADGSITWVEDERYHLEGEELAAVMSEMTSGDSVYNELKRIVYGLVQSRMALDAAITVTIV